MSKPPILLVAFGTSVPEAYAVYERILAQARQRYPGHEIRLAFTSNKIIAKWKEAGKQIPTPAEALTELQQQGATAVAIQSLHVVPGQKNEELLKINTKGLKIAWGAPLLSGSRDFEAVLKGLQDALTGSTPTIVVCHGNSQFPEYNRELLQFADKLHAQYPHAVACSVEGSPGTQPLDTIRPKAVQAGEVRFVPLMLIAGDHILNDVMGDTPESWKNMVGAKKATCLPPLGENVAIMNIYFQHLDEALTTLASTK